jgi:hypothetical protein
MKETKKKGKKYGFSNILLIPVLVVVFVFFVILVINQVDYPNSDFFTFWLSGRLFSLGENPYDRQVWIGGHHQFGATWIPNATFIYRCPLLYCLLRLDYFHFLRLLLFGSFFHYV